MGEAEHSLALRQGLPLVRIVLLRFDESFGVLRRRVSFSLPGRLLRARQCGCTQVWLLGDRCLLLFWDGFPHPFSTFNIVSPKCIGGIQGGGGLPGSGLRGILVTAAGQSVWWVTSRESGRRGKGSLHGYAIWFGVVWLRSHHRADRNCGMARHILVRHEVRLDIASHTGGPFSERNAEGLRRQTQRLRQRRWRRFMRTDGRAGSRGFWCLPWIRRGVSGGTR